MTEEPKPATPATPPEAAKPAEAAPPPAPAAPKTPEAPEAPEKPSALADAKATVAALKKENDRMEANLKKAERLTTENILSGRAPAGRELTQDDKVEAEAKRILKGSGYDKMLFPEKKA